MSLLLSLLLLVVVFCLSAVLVVDVFRVSFLHGFLLSPLLLIVWTWVIHSTALFFAEQGSFEITLAQTSNIAFMGWAVLVIWRCGRTVLKKPLDSAVANIPILAISAFSVSGWVLGIGLNGNYPKDADSLSNALIFRRSMTMVNSEFCHLANDVFYDSNIRFESCGAAVLSRFANVGNFVSGESILNLPFLLTAALLPLSAALIWRTIDNKMMGSIICGVVSISFLIYPYGINGLMRLNLGIVFIFPLLALLARLNELQHRQFALMGIGLFGLGYIHLLPFSIVLTFWLVQALATFTFQAKKDRSVFSFIAIKPLMSLVYVIPSTYIFLWRDEIFKSIKNVISITAAMTAAETAAMTAAETAAETAIKSESLVDSIFAAGKELFLQTDWTRPQPVMVTFAFVGLFLLLKQQRLLLFGHVFMALSLYGLYFVSVVLGIGNILYESLFLSNWYRLVAVMEVFLVLPTSFALYKFLTMIKNRRMHLIAMTTVFLLFAINIATGFSIVNTAWQRGNGPSKQVIESFDALEKYKNLRTLNNPSDGSSWAYARIGMNITSPNDRGEYLYFGSLIEKLGVEAHKDEVCAIIREQNVEAVLWVNGPAEKITSLKKSGLIDELLVENQDIVLGSLSATYLSSCSTQ
jgi:hypothetical protein